MSTVQIPGGSYCDSPHEYRDVNGKWVPSLTQVLSLSGLSSYNGCISKEVMENAARRGTAVHQVAWALARYGDFDPSWQTDEIMPYVEAYKKFLHESGFEPDPDFVEKPMIACVHGMAFGVTPDVLGSRGKFPTVVELKTVAQAQPSWAFQTAAQELAIFNTNRCGRARRWAVQLLNTGKYKTNVYERHEYDVHVFVSALTVVHERLAHGQKLMEGE